MKRSEKFANLHDRVFDVLVIGGGITGAGVVREAAWMGFDALLVEKSDFASGTSSRSSKLLHGGLRYLENYEFGLVFEAVRERMDGYRIAPHLVKPIQFLFPQYKQDRPGMNIMSLGLWLYDAMAGMKSFGLHKRLNKVQFSAAAKGIRAADLLGGFRYWDAQTNDARLTLEAIMDAEKLGGTVLNWTNVKEVTKVGDLWSCTLLDRLKNEKVQVRARTIAIAAGPWLDRVTKMFESDPKQRMRPTKGVHVLVSRDRFPLDETIVVMHPRDARVTFAIPNGNTVVIGTTDTDYPDPVREPEVTKDDVDYALEGVNHLFPDLGLQPEDVLTSYAGLRPLVYEEHKSESEVSREHEVFRIVDHVYAIAGGKLTTWRVMGSDMVKVLVKDLKEGGRKPQRNRRGLYRRLLPGGVGMGDRTQINGRVPAFAKKYNLSETAANTALFTYGARAHDALQYAQQQEKGLTALGVDEVLLGCLMFSVEQEYARSLDDLLRRRSSIFYNDPDQGRSVTTIVADAVAPLLAWQAEDVQREIDHYIQICDHFLPKSSAQKGESTA